MANSDKNILITPNIGSSSDPKIEFKGADTSTGPSTITAVVYPTNNGTLSFDGSAGQLFSINNNLTSGSIFAVNDVSGIPSIDVNANGTISLGVYGGGIGIGTASPSGKIDIFGGQFRIRACGTYSEPTDNAGVIAYDSIGGDLTISARSSSGSTGISFRTSNSGTGAERARIDSSGRLLVGTSSALTNLYDQATSYTPNVQFSSANQSYNAGLSLINYSALGYPATLTLGQSGSNVLGTNALVGSGNCVGSVNFVVNDGTNFRSGATVQAFVDATSGGGDVPTRLVFSTTADGAASPTERMRITAAGALSYSPCNGADLVGTESCGFVADNVYAPVYKVKSSLTSTKYAALFFNGNGQVGNIMMSGSSTAYNTSSDYRLKENVTPVPDGITRLLQLKPSRFNFKADPDHTVDGFLAHEAQAVVPECVTGEKDAVDEDGNPKYQGIDQSKLVPLLTAALQEAIAKIETLEARLTAAGIE